MTTPEIVEVCRKSLSVIERLAYDNTKLHRLIEEINQRDDVTDDTRRFIIEVLEGKKGTH